MAEILTRRVSPIHISFPLHRRPRLTVSVWRRFAPEQRNLLSIEVANVGSAPLEITGVYVSFMHTFLPTELLFGKRGPSGSRSMTLPGNLNHLRYWWMVAR